MYANYAHKKNSYKDGTTDVYTIDSRAVDIIQLSIEEDDVRPELADDAGDRARSKLSMQGCRPCAVHHLESAWLSLLPARDEPPPYLMTELHC